MKVIIKTDMKYRLKDCLSTPYISEPPKEKYKIFKYLQM